MKKNTKIFRLPTLVLITFLSFTTMAVIGQKNKLDTTNFKNVLSMWPTGVTCSAIQNGVCNFVSNNIYNTTCYDTDPFWQNCVSDWGSVPGSPQLNVFGPQLATGVNHASMWAASYKRFNGALISKGEGIVTGIPKLTPGKKYAFSIFKRFFSSTQFPAPDLDNFYIVLMKCSNYLAIRTTNDDMPNIPAGAQTIYCETNLTNNSFQRVSRTFIANDEFDIVWIFPKQTTYSAVGVTLQSWLEVAKFELIDVNNFSAGVSPTPTYPNCMVEIGPNTPNCGFEGGVFTWYGPNGQVVSAPANQKIQIDASQPNNAGLWTLKLEIPNIVLTNSTCGNQNLIISANVNVAQCLECLPAQILSTGYLDHGTIKLITPNTQNVFCIGWEDYKYIHLFTNNSSNNLWYINDTPIPTTGTYANLGWVAINNNTNEIVCGAGQNLKFQVKNLSPICPQLSPATYVETIGIPYNNNHMGSYKPDFTKHITAHPISQSPYNEIYSWSIPGTTISNLNPSTGDADVYFPATIQIPLVTGTLSITNSPYCNGVYPIYFEYNPNAFANGSNNYKTGNQSTIIMYPNPTSNQLTITSKENITNIEISDLMNPILKQIKNNNSKSITISINYLKPGIYNCKITTDKGVENQKLIIQR